MSKEEIRKKIDALDAQILALLNERMGHALQTSKFKTTVYDPVREKQIIERLSGLNEGPLEARHIEAIYREIMSASRNLQKPVSVAFLGPRATFSHAAALKRFGTSIEERPCKTIAGVFDEVEKGTADFGVVPFENSSEGVINFTLDRFTTTTATICGEIYNRIELNIISKQDSLSKVKKIYTHAKPMEQCARWLRDNCADISVIQVSSTGEAAKLALKSPTTAAVASMQAADIYGLKVIEKNIEDAPDNETRFLVISNKPVPRSGNDKTSILFSVRHQAGALFHALKPFDKHGVNLNMMQARPSRKGQWEYIFFVDVRGHAEDENVTKAFNDMKNETIILKNLGSYPAEK